MGSRHFDEGRRLVLSGPGQVLVSQRLKHSRPHLHVSTHGHFVGICLVVVAFPFKIVVNYCKLSDFSLETLFISFQ